MKLVKKWFGTGPLSATETETQAQRPAFPFNRENQVDAWLSFDHALLSDRNFIGSLEVIPIRNAVKRDLG
jgi:hypothetical protein